MGIELDLLNQVGNDLGIGFGDEFVALCGKFTLEVQVVLHNAVVDNDDAAGAVAMGVRVLFCRPAVGGPARVADAVGAVEGVVAEDMLKVDELAGGAADLEGFAVWAADGDACRIVAAILETPQPLNDDGNYWFWTDIAYDSAHRTILCDGGGPLRGAAMQAGGEIAIGFAGQRVRSALESVGHDVAALHVHFGYPSPPIPANKWFVIIGVRSGCGCKYGVLKKLSADMPFQRSYGVLSGGGEFPGLCGRDVGVRLLLTIVRQGRVIICKSRACR